MGKKHKKYRRWLGDDDYDAYKIDDNYLQLYSDNGLSSVQTARERDMENVLKKMLLKRCDPGVFLGLKARYGTETYVGIPQGTEGNIIVVGGNGSGKSFGFAKPTLMTWQGTMCVTDIKGELSDYYGDQYCKDLVTRPYIVFDLTQVDGPSVASR